MVVGEFGFLAAIPQLRDPPNGGPAPAGQALTSEALPELGARQKPKGHPRGWPWERVPGFSVLDGYLFLFGRAIPANLD